MTEMIGTYFLENTETPHGLMASHIHQVSEQGLSSNAFIDALPIALQVM